MTKEIARCELVIMIMTLVRVTPNNKINSANNFIYLSIDQLLLHPLVLRTRLQGHGVHAPLAAVVAHSQPVLLDTLQVLVSPREEVSAERRETLNSPPDSHAIKSLNTLCHQELSRE